MDTGADQARPAQYLYHLCPLDLRDGTLYPLSALRERHPDLYARELGKWTGREAVLRYVVPHVDAAWADLVNLSMLDPRRLVELRGRLGVPTSRLLERRVVRIPAERLAGRSAARYVSTAHWLNTRPGVAGAATEPAAQDFSRFDAATYREPVDVPPAHERYLREQHALGEPALGFAFVPHVLVLGAVDLAGLDLEPLTPPGGGRSAARRGPAQTPRNSARRAGPSASRSGAAGSSAGSG